MPNTPGLATNSDEFGRKTGYQSTLASKAPPYPADLSNPSSDSDSESSNSSGKSHGM